MKIMDAAHTIPDAWYRACIQCIHGGRDFTIERGSYVGQQRRQLDKLAFSIARPDMRPLAVTWQGVAVSNDDAIQDYFADYIVSPEIHGNEAYTYGSRIAPHLSRIAEMLTKTPNTNQACLEVGRPEDVELDDPPCLRVLSWKVTGAGLQLTTFWRSWDLFVGLPTNLGGMQLLNELMAEWTGCETGELVCYSDGAHLYDHHWDMFG